MYFRGQYACAEDCVMYVYARKCQFVGRVHVQRAIYFMSTLGNILPTTEACVDV